MSNPTPAGEPIGRDRGIREFELEYGFEAPIARVFVILGDIHQWPAENEPRMLVRKDLEKVGIGFADMTRATLTFAPGAASATRVRIRHELCKSDDQVRAWQTYWAELAKSIRDRLSI
ncbi:MAG: hypothetical protein RL016_393 [Actinomycetota bacterium]|jgi:hypothetical protein